jgi:hypothetical protein
LLLAVAEELGMVMLDELVDLVVVGKPHQAAQEYQGKEITVAAEDIQDLVEVLVAPEYQ